MKGLSTRVAKFGSNTDLASSNRIMDSQGLNPTVLCTYLQASIHITKQDINQDRNVQIEVLAAT
jgi:hypothetical protein